MIPFEKALEIVTGTECRRMTKETIPFTESLNRVLYSPVVSDTDLPPFNKAAMDGFAARKTDLGNDLDIIETIPAGYTPRQRIGVNQCSRIMTGGVVPEGADCVVEVELTEQLPTGRIRITGTVRGTNISSRAEDVKNGDVVLNPGKVIRPQDIGIMAATGQTRIEVSKKPWTGIISTGSELVEPGETPSASGIRNSNSYQLIHQTYVAGGTARYYGIAKDDEAVTFSVLQKALSENDIVIITGGVSMGDFDFVPSVMERAGVKILFSGVAVKPGKPTTFGIHENAILFGLPGNPVSSFMLFELMVRPVICKMLGSNWKPLTLKLPMKEGVSRKYTERMALIPVKLTPDGMALPVEYHGSGHLTALTDTWGIVTLPVGTKTIEKGELVSVRQI
ncbi:MAG: molybdopterin molybdotransferase MoeA [Bacteroidales bacterium]|nr:molybdopterin molybdotransferase MoeA [Bacteroidales bacterium]MBN2634250.1 molybdopterin molybdotransferase MoeA [Bacteroidales bacterium]